MRFGVQLGVDAPTDPDALVELAGAAEAVRFDSFWVGDHFVMPVRIDEQAHGRDVGGKQPFADRSRAPISEPLTTLCFLAGSVSRLRLGIAVLVVPLRNPVQAAKMLANLDVLSRGRLDIGVGTGWIEPEFEALRTPPFERRGRVTDDYLDVMIELWTNDEPRIDREHYRVSGITLYPKPIQSPHPPLWIGGNGPAAIRRAARVGHGWMPLFQPPETLPGKITELERLRSDYGSDHGPRPPAVVAVGCRFGFHDGRDSDRPLLSGTPRQMRDDVKRYEDVGIDELHLITAAPNQVVAEVVDAWKRFDDEVIDRL
ncbi:MAG: TIGR03619 family F420-dependent LLM class oxidoreductase [Actinomycetota bacterium]